MNEHLIITGLTILSFFLWLGLWVSGDKDNESPVIVLVVTLICTIATNLVLRGIFT